MDLFGRSVRKQVDSLVDGLLSQLGGILLFLGVIWLFFLTDYIPFLDWHQWFAIRPRQVVGLHGILTMPFAHGSLAHILSNMIPLVVALLTLATLRPKSWPYVVGLLIVVSGALTWALGENNPIIGSSGLVLALVMFLISPGVFLIGWWGWNRARKQSKPYPFQVHVLPLAVSGLVGFFCLDNLFFNLVPISVQMDGGNISWRAHWCGALAGCLVAFLFARSGQADSIPDTVNQVFESQPKQTT